MATADREKRWLVVVQSGDHVTLGRQTDPSEAEIAEIGKQLDDPWNVRLARRLGGCILRIRNRRLAECPFPDQYLWRLGSCRRELACQAEDGKWPNMNRCHLEIRYS